MQHAITFSIVNYLRVATGINAIWLFDGVKLPAEKPFITVEQMQNGESFISKGRETLAR